MYFTDMSISYLVLWTVCLGALQLVGHFKLNTQKPGSLSLE